MKSVLNVGCKSLNEDAAMPRNTETDDNGRLTSDLICPSCRYNLRGIRQNGACPECGFSIEKAILTANTPHWTRFQVVLSTLAIAYGVVLPIVNYIAWEYQYNIAIILGFVVLCLGGLAWFLALMIVVSNRTSTRMCLLIMVGVLVETVIAIIMIVVAWGTSMSG